MARAVFASEEVKSRLGEAVRIVEERSAAEVVVAVRPRSGQDRDIDFAAGSIFAYVTLLYTLFAPQVFELGWIALLVVAGFAVGTAAMRAMPTIRTRLAGRRVDDRVRMAARACFVELDVSATSLRSGILVFVSVMERRCVVVADIGVTATIGADAWAKTAGAIERSIRTHGVTRDGADALAAAIEASADLLAEHLPRDVDDVDELENLSW